MTCTDLHSPTVRQKDLSTQPAGDDDFGRSSSREDQPPCFSRKRSTLVFGGGTSTLIRDRLDGLRPNSCKSGRNWLTHSSCRRMSGFNSGIPFLFLMSIPCRLISACNVIHRPQA